jgi:hypothetical protein
MFAGLEVSYHQTHSARDWLSILRTPYRGSAGLILWRRKGPNGPTLEVYNDDDDDNHKGY